MTKIQVDVPVIFINPALYQLANRDRFARADVYNANICSV
jgi:hypothetical protein